jgi:hypothetical protein
MPVPPLLKRCVWLLLGVVCLADSIDQQVRTIERSYSPVTLQYGVEWRLIRAGLARLTWAPQSPGYQADLHVESAGIVSKLYRVNDDYRAQITSELCVSSIFINAEEGKRRRETKVTFDADAGKASYLERDLVKNSTVLQKETETPDCVHEYIGGLNKLRSYKMEPGQSVSIPMSDGKKFANVRVDARERDEIKTALGTFNTMKYEVHMFNDVLVKKKARLYLWLTDDSRQLPVQIQVKLQFLIGTITLQLEKEERN